MSEVFSLLGDGKLHISEHDFRSFCGAVLTMATRMTDGNGLKVMVRFDHIRTTQLAFDMLATLTSEAGRGESHYDLVLGGVSP